MGLGNLRGAPAETLADVLDEEDHEGVESLAHRLEHDDTQRDAGQGVEHAEDLAAYRLGRGVAVT